jgi:steroid 5-alpha reductase family enzyme
MPVLVFAVVIAVVMLSAWLVSGLAADVSIVDPVWGPSFGIVALAAALSRPAPHPGLWILAGLTLVWGGRLGLHLARRKLAEPGEDRRYAAMRAKRPRTFWLESLGIVFTLQGLLIGAVALPIEAVPGHHPSVGWLIVPGVAIWLVGLGFEAVGDEQLRRFKADPGNRGAVMDRGLWRYTRHPNYFGDACVWWGLWLVALAAGTPVWTVLGPLLMTGLLARGSGKPVLERDIAERRPGYVDYVERTSGFIPWPPRGASR